MINLNSNVYKNNIHVKWKKNALKLESIWICWRPTCQWEQNTFSESYKIISKLIRSIV